MIKSAIMPEKKHIKSTYVEFCDYFSVEKRVANNSTKNSLCYTIFVIIVQVNYFFMLSNNLLLLIKRIIDFNVNICRYFHRVIC